MSVSLFLYGLVVLALLVAEFKELPLGQYIFKPLAALGFVLIAIQSGAFQSDYGLLILAGLVFCYLGDVLLLSRASDHLFRAGMMAFALGHILYILAFWRLPSANHAVWQISLLALLCIIAAILILRNFKPHMPTDMVWPVILYIGVIMMMVWRALWVEMSLWYGLVIVAAIMFAVSDFFVARDRFVKPNPKNALAITPLYFGAQALFALSTQI